MKPSYKETQQSELFQSGEIPQKQTKFKEYLQQKVKKIQQTKTKTIKMTQKYFAQLKDKIDKYLGKQQKRILNSYQDNINMSINCMNHHYLFNFETIWVKNQKTKRKFSKQEFQVQNAQKPRKNSFEGQNQLAIKLQVKKLIQEMIFAESHLNQTVKLIGDELKNQMQKLTLPLGELFSKIPKLTQINQNSSTLLIKQVKNNNDQKKNKGSNKFKRSQVLHMKNPQISAQKIRIQDIDALNDDILSSQMTQRLLNKSRFKHEHIQNLNMNGQQAKLLRLKLLSEKQDHISSTLNKFSKHKDQLVQFDLINGKSLFHVYKRQLQNLFTENNFNNVIPQQQQQNPANQKKYRFLIYVNDKHIITDENQPEWIFEKHCKIQFESKPQRQYLVILTSKIQKVQQNQQNRKYKNLQLYIFNYKGDLITKDLIQNFRVLQSQKVVNVFQIPNLKQFIFVVLNNRVKRFSLKNLLNLKNVLYGSDEKIIRAQTNQDKIIIFEGRKKNIHVLSSDLILLQTIVWTSVYPAEVQINQLIRLTIKSQQHEFGSTHQVPHEIQPHNQITLIIPKIQSDSILYIQNGFLKRLQLKFIKQNLSNKQRSISLEVIQSVFQIHHGIYLVVSKRSNLMKTKTDLFLLQFYQQDIMFSQQGQSDSKGNITYLETINQDVIGSGLIKNQLYFMLSSGKVTSYNFY